MRKGSRRRSISSQIPGQGEGQSPSLSRIAVRSGRLRRLLAGTAYTNIRDTTLQILLNDQQSYIRTITTEPIHESELEKNCVEIAHAYELSQREYDVMLLIGKGHTPKSAANVLYISPSTAQTHIKHIYQKLGVHSRTELIEFVNLPMGEQNRLAMPSRYPLNGKQIRFVAQDKTTQPHVQTQSTGWPYRKIPRASRQHIQTPHQAAQCNMMASRGDSLQVSIRLYGTNAYPLR